MINLCQSIQMNWKFFRLPDLLGKDGLSRILRRRVPAALQTDAWRPLPRHSVTGVSGPVAERQVNEVASIFGLGDVLFLV